MSSLAPVVGSPKTSSSAVRPPSSMASSSTQLGPGAAGTCPRSGRASVQPSARPRATIDTLWIGSVSGEHVADQGVAGLVVGDDALLLVGHDPGLALGAGDAPGRWRSSIAAIVMSLAAAAGREQRRLVHEVGEVGAGEAGRAAGQHVEADVVGRAACPWRARRGSPCGPSRSGWSTTIWRSKRPGPQQGGVEDVGPVGGGDEDDAGAGVEAVHLDEQLVEGLLPLVVAAAQAGAAVAADGVDLVDEHDGGRRLLGLLEQVADPAGADADEHLDEVGARDREERHARPRRPRPGPAASCRCRAGRRAARPWGSGRRWPGSGPGPARNSLISCSSSTASSAPATSAKVTLGSSFDDLLGPGLAELHDAAAAALHDVHDAAGRRRRAARSAAG